MTAGFPSGVKLNMNSASVAMLMNCNTLDELLNVEFGEAGTPSREEFNKETEAFCLAQTLKAEDKNQSL